MYIESIKILFNSIETPDTGKGESGLKKNGGFDKILEKISGDLIKCSKKFRGI